MRSVFNYLDYMYESSYLHQSASLQKINVTFRHFLLFIIEPIQFFQSLPTKLLPTPKIKLALIHCYLLFKQTYSIPFCIQNSIISVHLSVLKLCKTLIHINGGYGNNIELILILCTYLERQWKYLHIHTKYTTL